MSRAPRLWARRSVAVANAGPGGQNWAGGFADGRDIARVVSEEAGPDLKGPWRWYRAIAIGCAILFVIIAGWTWWISFTKPQAIDFLSYWAAARFALAGDAASAYDIAAHHALEVSVAPVGGLLPFPYPPPFLFMVTPFGLVSFPLGFALWITATAALYLVASRSTVPTVYALAHPEVLGNFLIGQNGFLTSAIFMGGTGLLSSSPWVGGALLGVMVIKPQLALLLPLALIAGREWRALGGAAASSIVLLLCALLVFGAPPYVGFFKMAGVYAASLQATRWPWNELASPFAFARFIGVPQSFALLLHAAVAMVATLVTIRAWDKRWPQRVPILAAATMLIPPYLFTYDALLLVVPLGWFIRRRIHPHVVTIGWICCLLPIATYFDAFPGPNPIPIAAMVCLWALSADGARTQDEPQRAPIGGVGQSMS